MDPRKFVDDSRDLLELSRADEIGAGRALLKACEIKEQQLVDEVIDRPVRSDNLVDTVEYKLGMARGLRFCRELQRASKKVLESLEKKGEVR